MTGGVIKVHMQKGELKKESSCSGELTHVLDYHDPELMPSGVIKSLCTPVARWAKKGINV
jgi:hypothetical protein